ncbi:MAG TPA: hypothetical protein VGM18_15010 [Candidatus Sulfotelmatobacter sp.]|jgi:ribosomal protein L37AE/L43A
MKRSYDEGKNGVAMELKYCEHCGGLWVRESGAGTVYCDKCEAKVADLPAPKKRAGRLILPVGTHTEIEKYEIEIENDDLAELDSRGIDSRDLEAVGGTA